VVWKGSVGGAEGRRGGGTQRERERERESERRRRRRRRRARRLRQVDRERGRDSAPRRVEDVGGEAARGGPGGERGRGQDTGGLPGLPRAEAAAGGAQVQGAAARGTRRRGSAGVPASHGAAQRFYLTAGIASVVGMRVCADRGNELPRKHVHATDSSEGTSRDFHAHPPPVQAPALSAGTSATSRWRASVSSFAAEFLILESSR
jgi:hypothetical protein